MLAIPPLRKGILKDIAWIIKVGKLTRLELATSVVKGRRSSIELQFTCVKSRKQSALLGIILQTGKVPCRSTVGKCSRKYLPARLFWVCVLRQKTARRKNSF